MPDRKSSDDVDQLMKDRRLGDLQYREFNPGHAATIKLADAAPLTPVDVPAAPSAPLAPPVLVATERPTTPVVTLPTTLATERAGPTAAPAAPRAKVHESPLNFTFERLRRQAVPARAQGTLLHLQLPPRYRVTLPERLERLQQRTLRELFNGLNQPPAARQCGG
ncbi:hypothetical protein [Solimonas marina]|uniref:Uncharacterized protein n=1 Tax=Solimonas marina TaxID=2714601 RepID=A0A969WAR3_9GAMM|nr:hypothetical protein [Solimonas marina]NKF23732.1 hypothetical protein [Solimonas marina]